MDLASQLVWNQLSWFSLQSSWNPKCSISASSWYNLTTVSGANRNTELKIWSCATWSCLQTINFSTPSPSTMELKAALDLSAKYLLLSDIHRKIVYVLRLEEVIFQYIEPTLNIGHFLDKTHQCWPLNPTSTLWIVIGGVPCIWNDGLSLKNEHFVYLI